MSKGVPDHGERQRRFLAYMTDQRVSDEEHGVVMIWLFTHALAYLLLTAAQAIWAAVTVVRVWRRREAGWATALRTGVHLPSLAGLVTARLIYAILRRIGVARLNRRTDEHASRLSG
jgi:hypothetical protein